MSPPRSLGPERILRAAPSPSAPARLAQRLLSRAIKRGRVRIETPAGEAIEVVGREPGPSACIQTRSWRPLLRIALSGSTGFARSYMAGEWSTPDLVALLGLAFLNAEDRRGASPHWPILARIGHARNRNSRRGSRRNVAAHYDLGNDFYKAWLDEGLTYSSGLFSASDQSLEQAQAAKFDRALALLAPRARDNVLEIGCGWGGFLERLLERTECAAVGVTLSHEQLAYARERLGGFVGAGRCELRLQDYRDIAGRFDRIASIEMLEAVGEAYWPTYFESLRRLLTDDGIAVLQVITIDEARFPRYRRRPDFIQRHIFPGGMLPTKRIVESQAARAGLKLVAREWFAESYALTLQRWRARFLRAWPAISRLGFDESFRLMWDYYLSYCQVGFENGALDVGLYAFVPAKSRA